MAQYDLPGNYIVFHYYKYLGNSNIYNNNNKKKNKYHTVGTFPNMIENSYKIDTPKIKTTYHFTSLTYNLVCIAYC